jgi:hypothetical protein
LKLKQNRVISLLSSQVSTKEITLKQSPNPAKVVKQKINCYYQFNLLPKNLKHNSNSEFQKPQEKKDATSITCEKKEQKSRYWNLE